MTSNVNFYDRFSCAVGRNFRKYVEFIALVCKPDTAEPLFVARQRTRARLNIRSRSHRHVSAN